jgi:hypothetical protein
MLDVSTALDLSEPFTGGIVNITNVKRTAAIAAMLSALVAGAANAQDPAPSAASTPGATGRDQSPTAQPVSAAQRLATASKILTDIQDRDAKPDVKEMVGQIKSHFSEMASQYGKAEAKTEDKVVERPIPATAPVGTSGTKSAGEKNDWKEKFSAVERDLTSIIGGGPSMGASTTGAPAAAPTPGAGMKDLPADLTKQLNDFRIQLELFYAASMGQSMSTNELK